MKVLSKPSIRFTCTACKAVCEGEEHEFKSRPTTPPSFTAQCAFCNALVTCFPAALIAKSVYGQP